MKSRSGAVLPPFFLVFSVQSAPDAFGYVVVGISGDVKTYGQVFIGAGGDSEFRSLCIVADLISGIRKDYPGVALFADSTDFWGAIFMQDIVREIGKGGWYSPVFDVASVFIAMGMDPFVQDDMEPDELPDGDVRALGVARQRARQLCEVLEGVAFTGEAPARKTEVLPAPSVDPDHVAVNVSVASGIATIAFDRPLTAISMPSAQAEQLGMYIAREARGGKLKGRKTNARH